mgnify:CR=1 FL=1
MVKNVNSLLAKTKLSCIDNSNIKDNHLNSSLLHLNSSGDVQLAKNFASYLSNVY